MDDRLKQRAGNAGRSQVAAWLATLVIFFLLITAPLLLRYRLIRASRNTWPPTPVWQGSSVLHGANGSAYPLYVKLRFERKHEGFGPANGKTNLIGTASFCTAQNTPLDLDISGSLDCSRTAKP